MPSKPAPNELNPDLLEALHEIRSVNVFPKGSTLFHHGSIVTGIHLVESGEVQTLLSTGPGQKQLLEVVGPGAILGLVKSMTGRAIGSPPKRARKQR